MARRNKKSTGSGGHINKNQNAASASHADQKLLKALQDFIIPLIVQVVDRKGNNNTNQLPSGPESRKLITALQEFISTIAAGSTSTTQNMIEVSLAEEDSSVEGDKPQAKSTFKPVTGDASRVTKSDDHDTLKKPQSRFHQKLLRALREHVFNTMPIRLLGFESHGSNLQITLLERGVIYTRLASALQENLHKRTHTPQKGETEKEAIKRLISQYARYAILSHTWLRTDPGEMTYGDWNKGQFNPRDPGYQKLVNFCKITRKSHGLAFGWMDTVCINKESSAELDESIRSMYNWYRRADVCIIYLSETKTISNIPDDTWFTRGWTLQELLAPNVIKFYNHDWKKFVEDSRNDRRDIQITQQIERATTISRDELDDIRKAPISRRMQLAANREVTREEDMAYSLMGIFNVSISTAYGEGGNRAFFRILQEILISYTDVLDIFNWAGERPDSLPNSPDASTLLPPSPQYYLCRSSNKKLLLERPMEALTLTHLGLRIPVILMPAMSISDKNNRHDPVGNYNATINITRARITYGVNIPTTYNILDKRISGPDGPSKDSGSYQITLAVFNFDGNDNNICILKTCAAIGLQCFEPAGKVTPFGYIDTIDTNKPIVFELRKVSPFEGVNNNEENDDNDDLITDWNKETYYRVKRSELAKHGMQLLTMYL